MSETLPLMPKELRLPAFGQYYQMYQDEAAENAWSYSQYLAALCEQEVARRFQSRISNWAREARLPRGKSFATLALNDLPQVVQKQIITLRDNTQWAHQANSLTGRPFRRGQITSCCSIGSAFDRTGHTLWEKAEIIPSGMNN